MKSFTAVTLCKNSPVVDFWGSPVLGFQKENQPRKRKRYEQLVREIILIYMRFHFNFKHTIENQIEYVWLSYFFPADKLVSPFLLYCLMQFAASVLKKNIYWCISHWESIVRQDYTEKSSWEERVKYPYNFMPYILKVINLAKSVIASF